MKYLKEYKLFENHEDIHAICKKYYITNYTINEYGSIDVDEHINLYGKGLTKLPLRLKAFSEDMNVEMPDIEEIKKHYKIIE